jgi:hypothetical protein
VADGILLERSGVPAVSLVTDSFTVTGDAMAAAYGFPGFEYVLTPHPTASLSREEIRERVVAMMPRILEILGVSQ